MINVIINAILDGISADYVVIDRDASTVDTGYDVLDIEPIARLVLGRLRAAHTIETVDALHALPIPASHDLSSVLIKSTALVDPTNGKYGLGDIYERNTDGTWCMLQDPSGADWGERQVDSADIPLPAIVIWGL